MIIMVFCAGLVSGCPEGDPQGTPLDGRIDVLASDRLVGDGGPCPITWALPDVAGDKTSCTALSGDYVPGSATDGWAACVSDQNAYVPFDASISSVARVAAFEAMMQKLLVASAPPATAFVEAKVAYTQAEGLDSRVSRREDEHYAKPTKACADMTTAELQTNKERCVGPAQMQPLLNQAFADGVAGKEPLVNAARVESTLLWFLYISVFKEATTCASTKKDCDSAYAYYTGGEARSSGKGLARYIRAVSPKTHDRIWDGLLAVRCWRDLDSAVPATDTTLQNKALDQLDRALLRGMALLCKSRVKAAATTCGEASRALWTSAQLLGALLDRAARQVDATRAATLRTELAHPTASASTTALIDQALEALFPCP